VTRSLILLPDQAHSKVLLKGGICGATPPKVYREDFTAWAVSHGVTYPKGDGQWKPYHTYHGALFCPRNPEALVLGWRGELSSLGTARYAEVSGLDWVDLKDRVRGVLASDKEGDDLDDELSPANVFVGWFLRLEHPKGA